MSQKLHKDDEVKVMKGKDKGKTGKIEKVFSKEAMVVVSGVNQFKRHVKGRAGYQKSEIITLTKPLSVGSVQLVCPHCKLITRVGYSITGKEKARICKKCGKTI